MHNDIYLKKRIYFEIMLDEMQLILKYMEIGFDMCMYMASTVYKVFLKKCIIALW